MNLRTGATAIQLVFIEHTPSDAHPQRLWGVSRAPPSRGLHPRSQSSVLRCLSSVSKGAGNAASVPGVRADVPPFLTRTAQKKSAVAVLHEADGISDSGWNVPCGSSRQRVRKSSPSPVLRVHCILTKPKPGFSEF